jgi:dCMP deaminase
MSVEYWDRRFLDMASLVGSWSKDPSTKVGAVIVDPLKRVRGIGFNGFARGVIDAPELLKNRDEKLSRMVHAEINAVLNACASVEGCTIYLTIPPCNMCASFLIQSGIKNIIWMKPSDELVERWGKSWTLTYTLLQEANVNYLEYPTNAS